MRTNERAIGAVLSRYRKVGDEIVTEIVRKSIHFMVAVVPALASVNLRMTVLLLAAGTLSFAYAETLRLSGRSVALISSVTLRAARSRDQGKFILGPITLGLGAMLALMLYPEPASFIAIYALAFGDGFASLIGKVFGRIRIPLTGGKTVEGSLACLFAVLLVAYRFTRDPVASLSIAVTATLLEALPTRDFDNIILPVGVGFFAMRYFM
jgi:phytol kinase